MQDKIGEERLRTFRAGNVQVIVGFYSKTAVTRSPVEKYLKSKESEGWRLPSISEIEYIQGLYGIHNLYLGFDSQGDFWTLIEKGDSGIAFNSYDLFFCIALTKSGNDIASALFVKDII
jgi:hypothetical protein